MKELFSKAGSFLQNMNVNYGKHLDKLGSGIARGINGIGHTSSLLSSVPGLIGIGLGAGILGAGSEAIKSVENTDIKDVGQLRRLKQAVDMPTYGLGAGLLGSAIGGIASKNKKGALIGGLVGAGLGVGFGAVSNDAKRATMGAIGGGLGMASAAFGLAGLALKAPGVFNKKAFFRGNYSRNPFDPTYASLSDVGSKMAKIGLAPLAIGGGMLGLSAANIDVFGERSMMNFAMKTKRMDQTQNMEGIDMAQATNTRVGGPMLFGGGSPKGYSMGATGDLALALHHKRHG